MPAGKVGRPRTRPKKTANVSVPVSHAERAAINAAAKRDGLSAAMWMREKLLGHVAK